MNIDKIMSVINNKELVILPTDTVYGIVGDALDENVIHKVFDAKKRDYSKPLILMISSIDMLKKYVKNISDLELILIDRYWPGKLTILFEKNEFVSDLITSNSNLVGIRYPDNKEIVELIDRLDKPLISTSCNISSKKVITRVDMIEKEMLDKISYVYDGGELGNVSSTIVQVIDNRIKIIRDGELSSVLREEFRGEII